MVYNICGYKNRVFSAVYKRIYRSLDSEFKKLFRLNRLFLQNEFYFRVLDEVNVIARKDYDDENCDVQPVSDPSEVSDMEMMMKAEALMQFLGQGFDDNVIKRRYLEALNIPNVEELMPKKGQGGPPPDPKVLLETEKLALERDKFELELIKSDFEIAKIKADIMKTLAEAEAKEAGPQIEIYKAQMQALIARMTNLNKARQEKGKKSE